MTMQYLSKEGLARKVWRLSGSMQRAYIALACRTTVYVVDRILDHGMYSANYQPPRGERVRPLTKEQQTIELFKMVAGGATLDTVGRRHDMTSAGVSRIISRKSRKAVHVPPQLVKDAQAAVRER